KCKDVLFSLDDTSSSLPSAVTNLLQESNDLDINPKDATIESSTTQIHEREDDEDMTPMDTTKFAMLAVPSTRARTLHLNYQVSSFLGVSLYYMNYMMLPNDGIYICAAPCHFWSKTSKQFERDPFWNPVRPPESA
ncbi:hypothetical protein JGD43_25445, partial [Salmonella enterica subsp. enterica serovar Goldcoast]|nr:hypothetical protein [Salmonella enterica subsp. enterica serovar Goldcoast]